MNIIFRELKSIRKSLIIWSVSMMFLIYVGMVKYAGVREAGDSMEEMMSTLPKGMKAVFGIGSLDLTQVSGYYIVFFLYFALLGGVHAIMQGSVVLSKEERDKTADFLMVKPIKRHQVVTSKILASLFAVVVVNLVTWVSSVIIVAQYNEGSSINGLIRDLMIALLILQVIFFSVGLLIGAIAPSTKKATGLSTGILLGTFLMSVVVDLYSKLDFLEYFTPFKYFDGKAIYKSGFDLFHLILSVVIIFLSLYFTYRIYQKKDLHV
ncbi:MAG: ABC transporter permease subunit [Clostridia bacterium]|nr:ABC transporter permease subunit [Clostridia bacterium]